MQRFSVHGNFQDINSFDLSLICSMLDFAGHGRSLSKVLKGATIYLGHGTRLSNGIGLPGSSNIVVKF